MKKILVIDDEPAIRDLLQLVLKRENYLVKAVENGTNGLSEVDTFCPDLVILDLMLPDYSGYELCKKIGEKAKVPIIMISAKNEIIDKVLGLELGAEDYLTKPFDNRELLARIKVVLRRYEQPENNAANSLKFGDLVIDSETKTVLKNGKQVSLTAKEFSILETLFKRPRKVFSRDELLEIVWGYDYLGDTRTVDMTVMRLRKKLEDDSENPKYIKTLYGFGYQFGGDTD
jgi:two-component system alkaline phosphatase synthesis response regulator PhoP/two-component system response regulator VicR